MKKKKITKVIYLKITEAASSHRRCFVKKVVLKNFCVLQILHLY